jgi:hypothetical protein
MEALANERNPGLREQRVSQQASAKSLERHGPIDSDRQPFRDLQGLVPSLASSYPRYSYAARNRVPVWCSIIAASGSMCGAIAQNYKLPRGSDSSILYGVLPRDYFKRDQLWGPLLGSTAEIAQCGFSTCTILTGGTSPLTYGPMLASSSSLNTRWPCKSAQAVGDGAQPLQPKPRLCV